MRLIPATALLLLVAGCFNVNDGAPDCTFRCNETNNYVCPDNYTCNHTDGYCHRNDFKGTCAFALPDASANLPDMSGSDMTATPDMTMTPDMSTTPDMTMDFGTQLD